MEPRRQGVLLQLPNLHLCWLHYQQRLGRNNCAFQEPLSDHKPCRPAAYGVENEKGWHQMVSNSGIRTLWMDVGPLRTHALLFKLRKSFTPGDEPRIQQGYDRSNR